MAFLYFLYIFRRLCQLYGFLLASLMRSLLKKTTPMVKSQVRISLLPNQSYRHDQRKFGRKSLAQYRSDNEPRPSLSNSNSVQPKEKRKEAETNKEKRRAD